MLGYLNGKYKLTLTKNIKKFNVPPNKQSLTYIRWGNKYKYGVHYPSFSKFRIIHDLLSISNDDISYDLLSENPIKLVKEIIKVNITSHNNSISSELLPDLLSSLQIIKKHIVTLQDIIQNLIQAKRIQTRIQNIKTRFSDIFESDNLDTSDFAIFIYKYGFLFSRFKIKMINI